MDVDEFELNESWLRIGKKVRFIKPYHFHNQNFIGESGKIVDVDASKGVYWVLMENKFPILDETSNEMLLDNNYAMKHGFKNVEELYDNILEEIVS